MRVLVDGKNFVTYGRGISQFVQPLLENWFASASDIDFDVVLPSGEVPDAFGYPNVNIVKVKWPLQLPSAARHVYFDQIAFPKAVSRLEPDLVFCPFHDVRVPRGFRSVVMIHDMCLKSHQRLYRKQVSSYYLYGLKRAIRTADLVMTDSRASVEEICRLTPYDREQIQVIPNGFGDEWYVSSGSTRTTDPRLWPADAWPRILYNGGWDRRKNAENLLRALLELKRKFPSLSVLCTGQHPSDISTNALLRELMGSIFFAERLSDEEMIAAYDESDLVVYASLCEGFGRVVVEAALRGARLACSDIPVFRELIGDYPKYFDATRPSDIAAVCWESLKDPKPEPIDAAGFGSSVAKSRFLDAMNEVLGRST